MKIKIICTFICIISSFVVNAQELKVTLSPDQRKIDIDTKNGVSSVIFESHVKDLMISSEEGDERIVSPNGIVFFRVLRRDSVSEQQLGYPKHSYIIKSPNIPEYVLKTPEIYPNSVLYYTVTLPDIFPLALTTEYLISKSSKYGFRVSLGKRFGGYVSYKWDKFRPSGNNIDNIVTDNDITNAEYLGYIRRSITGGARFGLFRKGINKFKGSLYLLVGGGYGEYGRQWKNPTQIENNIYFYSDYMKGFDGELSLQATCFDWLTLSIGTDMLIAKRKISVDYMIGLGVNLNFSNLRKKKI